MPPQVIQTLQQLFQSAVTPTLEHQNAAKVNAQNGLSATASPEVQAMNAGKATNATEHPAVKAKPRQKVTVDIPMNSTQDRRVEKDERAAMNSVIAQGLALPSMQTHQPFVAQPLQSVAPVANDSSAATARTKALVDVVDAVCDKLMVSPGVLRGEGMVQIQLKPDVLDGAAISIEAKGRDLTIMFYDLTYNAQQILERNMHQFEQHLAGRIHNYQISVSVKKGKDDERV